MVRHLELEEFLELLLHLLGVCAAAPVAGQPVRVRHNLQQRKLRLKGDTCLRYERPAHRQHYAQSGRPPAHAQSMHSWIKQSTTTTYHFPYHHCLTRLEVGRGRRTLISSFHMELRNHKQETGQVCKHAQEGWTGTINKFTGRSNP